MSGTTSDSGTGKSHLLIVPGAEAAMADYTLAAKLVDDKQLTKTINR